MLARSTYHKIPTSSNGTTVNGYLVGIINTSDYSPFGVQLDGRTVFDGRYRYGAQGQEKDDEIKGEGNSYTAEFWQYDSRLGRRWNVDPVVKEHESPYVAFANNPIWFVDPSGADTINVVSKSLRADGNKLKTDASGNEIPGQEHLFLFQVYTEDSYKGDMNSDVFLANYQMLAKRLSASTDGASNTKPFVTFLGLNSNKELVKKALYMTTVNDLNKFASNGLADIGGKGGGLSSWEKWTLFNHGEEYDFKSQKAKGFGLTYVEGVGVFESDHLGNIIYGSIAARAGQGLNSSLSDGDWLTKGGNSDDPYDGYSLAIGHFFGNRDITKSMLLMNNVSFVKKTSISILAYNFGYYGPNTYAESYLRNSEYTITVGQLEEKNIHTPIQPKMQKFLGR